MKTNKISITLKLNTEAEEQKIFKVLKEFATEQFQDYELEVCGYNETLKHKLNKELIQNGKKKRPENRSTSNSIQERL